MGAAVRSSYALAKLQRASACKPGLEVAHPDLLDGRIWVAGADDCGDMAQHLADPVQRLKRGGMARDDDPVGAALRERQFLAEWSHRAAIWRERPFQALATSSVLEQDLRRGLGDRRSVEPISRI